MTRMEVYKEKSIRINIRKENGWVFEDFTNFVLASS